MNYTPNVFILMYSSESVLDQSCLYWGNVVQSLSLCEDLYSGLIDFYEAACPIIQKDKSLQMWLTVGWNMVEIGVQQHKSSCYVIKDFPDFPCCFFPIPQKLNTMSHPVKVRYMVVLDSR